MSTKVSYIYGKGFDFDFHVYWDYSTDSYMFDFDGNRLKVSDEWVITFWKAMNNKGMDVINLEPTINHLEPVKKRDDNG